MDLLAITSGAIDLITPRVLMTVKISTGNTISPDGTPVPSYATPFDVLAEIQPLSTKDLRQIDGLNLQGTLQAMYIEGQISGIVRVDNKGGDLVIDGSGKTWLVNTVLESWPNWCKVVVTLQNTP